MAVINGAMLVLDAYVHHYFHLGCENLFREMEVMVVRSSNVEVGKESLPVKREISVQELAFKSQAISLILIHHVDLVCVMI